MQAPQLRPGLDADLADEQLARVAVRLKSLRLAAAAVEREHPLRVQALPEGVLRNQLVEFTGELLVMAGGESVVDGDFTSAEPELFETADLGRRERLVGQVIQR